MLIKPTKPQQDPVDPWLPFLQWMLSLNVKRKMGRNGRNRPFTRDGKQAHEKRSALLVIKGTPIKRLWDFIIPLLTSGLSVHHFSPELKIVSPSLFSFCLTTILSPYTSRGSCKELITLLVKAP
jgi:hypothetical protein